MFPVIALVVLAALAVLFISRRVMSEQMDLYRISGADLTSSSPLFSRSDRTLYVDGRKPSVAYLPNVGLENFAVSWDNPVYDKYGLAY